MHIIDMLPSVGARNAQERAGSDVGFVNVLSRGASQFRDHVHYGFLLVLSGSGFLLLALGFQILDAEVVGMCRGIVEGDLQGFVQILECGIGGTGKRTPDWRIVDLVWTKVKFQDVVGTFTMGFVDGPVLGLAFGTLNTRIRVENSESRMGVYRHTFHSCSVYNVGA